MASQPSDLPAPTPTPEAKRSRYPSNVDGRRVPKPAYVSNFRKQEYAEGRRRHWKVNFLREYANGANITKACKIAGVSVFTYRKARQEDPSFDENVQVAHQAAVDRAWEVAWEIGVEGTRKPLVQNGEVVGYVREQDFKATRFVLESLAPERFSQRERIARLGQMDAGELAKRRDALLSGLDERMALLSGPATEVVDAEVEEDDD